MENKSIASIQMCELLKYKDDTEIKCILVIFSLPPGILKVSAG